MLKATAALRKGGCSCTCWGCRPQMNLPQQHCSTPVNGCSL